MATRNMKKVALSALGLGGATAAVVFGSWAAWTAETTNPGNSVTAGRLTMANQKGAVDSDGNPVLTTGVSAVQPGDGNSDTVTITNTGTGNMAVKLTKTAGTDAISDANNVLKLTIFDSATGNCIYPAGPGACPTLGAATAGAAWTGAFANAAAPGIGGAAWATNEAHDFVVTWKYTDDGTVNNSKNDATAKTASFDLTWSATPA